jgi:hypothetical protein
MTAIPLVAAALFLTVATGDFDTPRGFLICQGFSAEWAAPTAHGVVLYGTMATIEGQAFRLQETPEAFTLYGPLPTAAKRISINRLTGAYTISLNGVGDAGRAIEWVRKGDPGCAKVARKF